MVTTVTSFSRKQHPSLADALGWAALYWDATGEIPRIEGYTVTVMPGFTRRLTATPNGGT